MERTLWMVDPLTAVEGKIKDTVVVLFICNPLSPLHLTQFVKMIANRVVAARRILAMSNPLRTSARFSSEWGSGSGKGGGSGGSIREAGGSFGKSEAAREEEFFRRKQKEQLEKMKSSLDKQKSEIEKQIKEHETELARLKKEAEK